MAEARLRRDVRDFLGRAEARERNVLQHLGADVLGDRRGHRGVNHAGRDGVGADTPARGLAGEHAHHGLHAGLRGGVVRLTEETLDRRDAAEAHDRAAVAHHFEAEFAADRKSVV